MAARSGADPGWGPRNRSGTVNDTAPQCFPRNRVVFGVCLFFENSTGCYLSQVPIIGHPGFVGVVALVMDSDSDIYLSGFDLLPGC